MSTATFARANGERQGVLADDASDEEPKVPRCEKLRPRSGRPSVVV